MLVGGPKASKVTYVLGSISLILPPRCGGPDDICVAGSRPRLPHFLFTRIRMVDKCNAFSISMRT